MAWLPHPFARDPVLRIAGTLLILAVLTAAAGIAAWLRHADAREAEPHARMIHERSRSWSWTPAPHPMLRLRLHVEHAQSVDFRIAVDGYPPLTLRAAAPDGLYTLSICARDGRCHLTLNDTPHVTATPLLEALRQRPATHSGAFVSSWFRTGSGVRMLDWNEDGRSRTDEPLQITAYLFVD